MNRFQTAKIIEPDKPLTRTSNFSIPLKTKHITFYPSPPNSYIPRRIQTKAIQIKLHKPGCDYLMEAPPKSPQNNPSSQYIN